MIIPLFVFIYLGFFSLSSHGKNFLLEMAKQEDKPRRAFICVSMMSLYGAWQYDKVDIRSRFGAGSSRWGACFEIEPLRGGHHV
jgi:hypothetical protein